MTELPSLNRNVIIYFLKVRALRSPARHRGASLSTVAQFLLSVSARRIQNRMTTAALGTVFGPFLLRSTPTHQEQVDISAFHQSTSLLKWMIEHAEQIGAPPEAPVPALAVPQKGGAANAAATTPNTTPTHAPRSKKAVEMPRLAIEAVKPTIERKGTAGSSPAIPLLNMSAPSLPAPARRKGTEGPETLSPPQIRRKLTGTEDDVFALTERAGPSPRYRRYAHPRPPACPHTHTHAHTTSSALTRMLGKRTCPTARRRVGHSRR